MHPQHQAAAVLGAVCPDAKGANFLGTGEHRLKDELEGQALGSIQFSDDLLRVRGHLSDCFLAIKVLAAGQEPDFGGFKIFHEVTWGENALAFIARRLPVRGHLKHLPRELELNWCRNHANGKNHN